MPHGPLPPFEPDPKLPDAKLNLIHTILSILGGLPPQGGHRLGQLLGDLWFYMDHRHRAIATNNLQRAFPRELSAGDRMRIARETFRNLAVMPFELGWSLRRTRAENLSRIQVIGREHLEEALGRRRGILILTAHTGNWEMLAAAAAGFQIRVNVVYRPLDSMTLERLVCGFRSRFGARLIPRADSLRAMIRALRRGEAVALLLDQNVGWRKGVFAPFFGSRACTHKVMAMLALKTGAPVVPLFMRRENGHFVAEFQAALPTRITGDRTADVDWNTQCYNKVIEAFVRCYPSQWLWLHRRWKTRPYCPWPKRGRWTRLD